MPDSRRTSQHRRMESAAQRIMDLTVPVFGSLAEVGRTAVRALEEGRTGDGGWDAVREEVSRLFEAQQIVIGAGLALDRRGTGTAGDVPYFIWWIRRNGRITRKHHVLNPRSEAYYDVTQARWFRLPLAAAGPTLMAPYVDAWGTDDFTMTASLPVSSHEAASLVVAADLDARRYVDSAERILAEAGASALLDEEQRAIASTRSDLETGTKLVAGTAYQVAERVPTSRFGWSVVTLAPRP